MSDITFSVETALRTIEGIAGSVAMPVLRFDDNVIVSFAGHHVIPQEVLNTYEAFFEAIGWDAASARANIVALPTINTSHYASDLGTYSIASREQVIERLEMPVP